MTNKVRRIVTGHDDAGRAIIVSDGSPERIESVGPNGPVFYEIWNTRETPARIDRNGVEPAEVGIVLKPPSQGTRIRVLDIAPEGEEMANADAETARKLFERISAAGASTHAGGNAPHPFMHRTESIDYGLVLEGEITLIVDKGETVVRAGDIVIQKGTNHAWANRSNRNCRIAFILIDGKFEEGLGE